MAVVCGGTALPERTEKELAMIVLARFGVGFLIGLALSPVLVFSGRVLISELFNQVVHDLLGQPHPDPDGRKDDLLAAVMFVVIPFLSGFIFAMHS